MRIKFIQELIDKIRGKNQTVPKPKLKAKYKNAKDVIKNNKTLKLHIGCGRQYKEGWINIDNNSLDNITKLDLKYDILKGIPFPNDSVDFIYNEHFFEHITVEEGQNFIKDCMRVLKKGGVLRIAMPDLDECVKAYCNPNGLEDDKEFLTKYGLGFIKTRAERLNVDFRYGHKWLYDWEELERRLKEAGCENIKKCSLRLSEHKELCDLETRDQSTLLAEVTK